jgi:PAS domain S-box-containing protein
VIPPSQAGLLDAIFGALDNGVILLDGAGVVIAWNPWLEQASGIASSDAIGKTLAILFPQTKSARLEAAISAALESGVSSVLTHSLHKNLFPLRTAAGRDLIYDVSVRPLGAKGSRNCLLQIDDVTVAAQRERLLRERHDARYRELQVIEEQLRQSQKMEAVGQLTGGIAHDFNNLLQGIIGSLDRVQYRIAQGRIGDVDRFLKGAVESANRAAALTHRLLAFSRRQPVDPKPVNVNALVGSIEELLRRSMGENITLKLNLAPSLWLIRCDANQLENALLNLVINARDAMPDGGTLSIETANVAMADQAALARDVPAGEFVAIKVSDSGVGMADDVKARAFDPFFTTKPIGQGTGLGLSMIYGFVRQSDGAVLIESAPDKGTEIEISLPRHLGEAAEPRDETAIDALVSDQGEVILVVEDEAVVRLLVVETLEDQGYRALEAANGDAALRILQSSQRIDLLITDIGLPGLNGRQLADAARTQRAGLKTLFMTGYAETAASNNFLQPGMEIISKPFNMDVLARRVQEMLKT